MRPFGRMSRGQRWAYRSGGRLFLVALLFVALALLGTKPRPSLAQGAILDADAWTYRGPTGWAGRPTTISVSVTSADGLRPNSAEYRLSTDGALNWSAWFSSVQTSSAVSTTVDIDATTSALIDSGAANRVQFRIQDYLDATLTSSEYVITVDATAPASPLNMQVTPSGWSKNASGFGLSWDNPTDISGIAGAYFQIDIDPLQGGTATYVAGDGIDRLTGISVSGEGEHTVYVWLKDKAGNSDSNTRKILAGAFKYDATGPSCDEPLIVGTKVGEFYTGPVRFTITGRDSLSGIAALHYQIEGQPVITVTVSGGPSTAQHSFTFEHPEGRRHVEYWATDTAGNTQATHGYKDIKFDTLAPASPISLTVQPSGWTSATVFAVTWTNPQDYSRAAAAYYKVGSEPQWASDGTYVAIAEPPSISVQVTREGLVPVYVWLKDNAGNTDYRTRALVTLQRDTTAPVTTISATGSTRNGYYIGPLTFSFASSDNLSSVTTRYQINGGAEQVWSGQGVFLDQEGPYRVTYYSVDQAGNREAAQTREYIVDLKPPVARIWVEGGQDYIRAVPFRLNWSGSDGPGSGVARYTVEYRRSKCAPWQSWYVGTELSKAFNATMTPNNYYYFRVRAEDRAGHIADFFNPGSVTYIYYEGLTNGFFDTGTWNGWTVVDGGLGASIVNNISYRGTSSQMAQLSHEWPVREVPLDAHASFYQRIQLPTLDCSDGLVLAFRYRIYSRDVMSGWVESLGDHTWIDTFDVYIKDMEGHETLILRDGNMDYDTNDREKLYVLPWKQFAKDLSAFSEQPIRIEFRVDNRWDTTRPTWVLIDDVRLVAATGRVVHLPMSLGTRARQSTAAAAETEHVVLPPASDVTQLDDEQKLPRRR